MKQKLLLPDQLAQGWINWNGGLINVLTGREIMPIRGGATNTYGGAYDVRDLQPNVQISLLGQRIVADYLLDILATYNSEWDNLRTDMLGPTITEYRVGIERESSALYLQPADEYSRPDAFRLGGRTTLDFPLRQYQRRTSWTRTYLARATLGDLMRTQAALVLQDTNTLIRDALLALFRVDNYVYNDEMYGDLTIRPFVNADGVFVPPPYFGNTFSASHTHYMATNGALTYADIGTTAVAHLREHGYSTNLVAWIDANLEDEVRAMSEFRPRPDPYTIIPALGSGIEYAVVTEPDAIGRLGAVQIVPKPFMPANYIFIWDKSIAPPLLERVHELPQFQGFNLVTNVALADDYPLLDAFYERWTGFAVNNRVNGFVIFVDAGVDYVTPAALLSSLAT